MQEPQELLLRYLNKRWEGVDASGTLIWMVNMTFQRYVQVWLEVRGIKEPSYEQRVEAIVHCRKLSYWKDCHDPDVHFISYRHPLERQRMTTIDKARRRSKQ
jgi:hypothetical protein